MKFNLTKSLFLVLLAFILSILDTSFFSFIPILGATIISSYITIINFSITGKTNDFLIFTISVIFFFSAFSSLPVWMIVLTFLLIPYLIHYVKNHFFPDPSAPFSIAFFMAGTFLFSLISLIYGKEWNMTGVILVSSFIFVNSLFGVFLYYISRKIKKNFTGKDINF
ncbi:MAG: hypothetical protein WC536_02710 [Patescibacteria group bacterium]